MFTWYDRLAADDNKSFKFMFSKYHWTWLEKKTAFPRGTVEERKNLAKYRRRNYIVKI